jgi:hypothetical protein
LLILECENWALSFCCSQNFKLFGCPIFWFWVYLMKVIPEALNLISTFLLKCFQIIIVRIVNFYQRELTIK